MKQFFVGYIKKVENELEKVEIVDSIEKFRYAEQLNEFPFIIIGSQVRLRNLSDKSAISLRMVHPVENTKSQSSNEITYLSYLGKELLLQGIGSEADI